MKAWSRRVQLTYINVEGMRVVMNNRCVAEQIHSDKVEDVATVGVNIGQFRKFGNSKISGAS